MFSFKSISISISVIIATISCVIFLASTHDNQEVHYEDIELAVHKLEIDTSHTRFYGIVADSLQVFQNKIKKNQVLSDLFTSHGISNQTIHQLVEKSKDVFNVKKIKSGNAYTMMCSKSKNGLLQCFVYEESPTSYIVFDLRDSIAVYRGEKQVKTIRKEAIGTIQSSLYATMYENNLPIELAIKLSEIYAWSIDFYHLQKNDRFKVVYEENFVDDESIGINTIITASFEHYGEPIYAIPFMQDSILDFYDENGQSLRKAFLKAPLKFSRISSGYTSKRFHPVQKKWKAHLGTDYAAAYGTPILATGDGVITEARYKKYNGNYVKIRHNSTYSTQYLHMQKIKKGIKPGKKVRQGDVIGYVGSTGLATGPHVCYRFWKNGSQVDPYKQKIPAVKPVKTDNLEEFEKNKKIYMNMLSDINEQTI